MLANAGGPLNFSGQPTDPGHAARMAELTADLPAGAAPTKKPGFFKKGGAIKDVLGIIGDNLTGNPIYANMVKDQREATLQEQLRQRRREEEMADWVAKQQWEQQNKGPELPGIAKEERYWRSVGRDDIADDIVAKHRMAMVQRVGPGDSIISEYVRPSQMMGGPQTDNIPTVASEADLDRLPPGAQFRAPDGSIRRKGGASPSNGSGAFPGPY